MKNGKEQDKLRTFTQTETVIDQVNLCELTTTQLKLIVGGVTDGGCVRYPWDKQIKF